MQDDERKISEDETEVEAHHRPKVTAPSEQRSKRPAKDDDEVQAHHWTRAPAPSEDSAS